MVFNWLRLAVFMVILGISKTHHLLRVIIVAALGLAGLWMLHTLAQDFNKIYNNFKPSSEEHKSFFAKRSINNSNYVLVNVPTTSLQEEPQIDWERILLRDPVACARSFVCQLAAIDGEKLSQDEENVLFLIRMTSQKENWATKQLQRALKYGQEASNPSQCRSKYRFCPYSSGTMMSLLRLFGGT